MSIRICRICNKEFSAHTRSVICTHEHIYECPICGKHIKLKRFKDIESIIMKTHLKEGKFRILKEVDNKVFFTIDFEELWFGACGECRAQNRDIIEALALKLREETNLKLFGVKNAFQNVEIKEKIKNTWIENYGVDNPSKDPGVHKKISSIMRKNGNNSSLENFMLHRLKELGAVENIDFKYEYKDERYPFSCDFYFPKTDTFLEINAHWTHGYHWFDKKNNMDIERLNKLKAKNTPYYNYAIKIWTESDPLKRQAAINNNLNYIVLWDIHEVEYFCEYALVEVILNN